MTWNVVPLVEITRLVGLSSVAIDAREDRPSADLDALADAGVFVACARLRGDLSLADVALRREQLRRLQRQVADAASLGAHTVWLEPVLSDESLPYLREGLDLLHAFCQARRTHLAVRAPLDAFPDLDLAASIDDAATLRRASARLVLVTGTSLPTDAAALLTEIGFAGPVVLSPPDAAP